MCFLLNPDATIEAGHSDDVPAAFEETAAMTIGPRLQHTSGRPRQQFIRRPGWSTCSTTSFDQGPPIRLALLTRRGLGTTLEAQMELVVGAALLIRRCDWEMLGGMDEGCFLWYEDTISEHASQKPAARAMNPRILVRHQEPSWVRLPRRRGNGCAPWVRSALRAVILVGPRLPRCCSARHSQSRSALPATSPGSYWDANSGWLKR